MTENMELFQKALIEARLRKSRAIIEADTEEVVFSPEHLRSMEKILRYSEHRSWLRHPKRGRKRLAALLIAAIVMILGGITVYANRGAIVEFVKQIFGGYTQASYRSDESAYIPQWIEQEYTLTYVPEGYELVEYEVGVSSIWTKWRNTEGVMISFTQTLIDVANSQYDNESSTTEQIQVNGVTIYCNHHAVLSSSYLWTDGLYSFEMECPSEVPLDEVRQMIESMTAKQE